MKTIRATVALLVVAGALPAVQAQGIPTVEACIRYAEADAVFDAAMQPALAAFEATAQEGDITVEAAALLVDFFYENAEQRAEAAYEAAKQRADAAFEAAMQQAEAAVEAVKQPAEQALVTAYSASYDIDDGARSDVPDVMMKLLDHRRQRCRELHGL